MAPDTRTIGHEDRQFQSASLDEIHYRIMDIMEGRPPGRVLDFPAGAGRLSWWLHRKGHEVLAADIMPEFFSNPEIPVVKADLDGTFPFENGMFDYAFCVEGPEHVENLYHTFREFSRVLKPGGLFIISYPNYSNIESRARMIFYGVLEPVEPREFHITMPAKNNGHINRQPYALLKMPLQYAGFRIKAIRSEKVKEWQYLFLPLVFIIKVFTIIKGQKGKSKYWLNESNSWDVLMGGNSLIYVMEKIHP